MGLKGENDFKEPFYPFKENKENDFYNKMSAKTIKQSFKNPFFKKEYQS
ncbi:hypothetical protein VN1169_08010 [Helicobacter pylori]|nr:hypothetical protein VN1169_08010 [Helicobacter pylori]